MLVGEGAVGKSSIVSGMALSLVTGKPLLGEKVHGGPKRVWIINLEDSGDEIARSIQAAATHHGISEQDIGNRLFVNAGIGSSFHIIKNSGHGIAANDELVTAMVADIIANQIDVVTIDPLVSTHGMSENDNMAMDRLAKTFALIADQTQCAIELVHHTGKGRSEGGAEAARGASSLVAAARSVVRAVRMTPSEAEKYGIEGEEVQSGSLHELSFNPAKALQRLKLGWLISAIHELEGIHIADEIPDPKEAMKELSRWKRKAQTYFKWSVAPVEKLLVKSDK
jgi:RecA-family ATPase